MQFLKEKRKIHMAVKGSTLNDLFALTISELSNVTVLRCCKIPGIQSVSWPNQWIFSSFEWYTTCTATILFVSVISPGTNFFERCLSALWSSWNENTTSNYDCSCLRGVTSILAYCILCGVELSFTKNQVSLGWVICSKFSQGMLGMTVQHYKNTVLMKL